MSYAFWTIAVIALLGALSPGPDFVLISKNSITHSRRAGILSSLGITVGILFHSFYCILGIAVVISQSLLAFSIIRYIGAAYLIYLGVKSLFSKTTLKTQPKRAGHKSIGDFTAFREGLLVNVLNPKCILFMLSIFTMVVKPHTPYWAQAIYGLELAGITGLWFCLLSYLLTHRHVSKRLASVQTVISKLMGVFLIGFGLDLIFSSHR
jgi:RhtB (resistance to homoserine/threonine) family protein